MPKHPRNHNGALQFEDEIEFAAVAIGAIFGIFCAAAYMGHYV